MGGNSCRGESRCGSVELQRMGGTGEGWKSAGRVADKGGDRMVACVGAVPECTAQLRHLERSINVLLL